MSFIHKKFLPSHKAFKITDLSEFKRLRTVFLCFLLGRLVTGIGVDVFFAVDAMLPTNIMFWGITGLITTEIVKTIEIVKKGLRGKSSLYA